MATTEPTIGGVSPEGFAINVPISSQSLQPTPVVPVSQPNYSPILTSESTGFIEGQTKLAEQQYKEALDFAKSESAKKAELEVLMGNKAADTRQTYDTQGVNKLYNQLSDINVRSQALDREVLGAPYQALESAAGQGRVLVGQDPDKFAEPQLRKLALQKLALAQDAAIVSGQYDKAKNYADQIVAEKYDKLQAEINAKLTNLQAYKDYNLSPIEKKLAEVTQARLEKEKQDLARKQKVEDGINAIKIEVAKNGGDLSLFKGVDSIGDALEKAKGYMSDPTERRYKEAQIRQLNANAMKTEAEARELKNSGGNVVTSEALTSPTILAAKNIGAIVATTKPQQQAFNKALQSNFEQGGEEQVKRFLRSQYVNKVLPAGEREAYKNVNNGISNYEQAIAYLEKNPDLDIGFYKFVGNEWRPKFNTPKDPRYNYLLNVINQAEAPIRKALYGTALTGTEEIKSKMSMFSEGDDRIVLLNKMRVAQTALKNGLDKEMFTAYGLDFEPQPYPEPEASPNNPYAQTLQKNSSIFNAEGGYIIPTQ